MLYITVFLKSKTHSLDYNSKDRNKQRNINQWDSLFLLDTINQALNQGLFLFLLFTNRHFDKHTNQPLGVPYVVHDSYFAMILKVGCSLIILCLQHKLEDLLL